MKRSCMVFWVCCSLIALLVAPRIVAAQSPVPLNQTFYVPNSGGGETEYYPVVHEICAKPELAWVGPIGGDAIGAKHSRVGGSLLRTL